MESTLLMKQAIAGVAPPELGEVTIMTVWPSNASTGLGRFLGRCYSIGGGIPPILTIGNLIALASIPVALALYGATKLNPFNLLRYRLTNRRVALERGLRGTPETWINLEDFDVIEVVVRPGQEWYPAGDLVFFKGKVEVFRISGILRPETFRQTCLKAQRGFAGVKRALAREAR